MILAQLLLMTATAWGNGHVVPNGGIFVRCPAENARSEIFSGGLALLDLFEARHGQRYTYRKLASFRGQSLETAFPKATRLFFGRSAFLTEDLKRHFRQRDRELTLSNRRASLFPHFSYWASVNRCEFITAAVQRSPVIPNPSLPLSIELYAPVWTNLETDQKLALLFHEYVFGEMLARGNACAYQRIWSFIGYMLSDRALKDSDTEWTSRIDFDCDPSY